MTVDIILTGGAIITDSRILDAAVAVDEGRIVGVGDEDAPPVGQNRVDAVEQVVMPDVVDPYIHTDNHVSVSTYRIMSSAATPDGVTTFADFARQAYEGADGSWDEPATLSGGLKRRRDQQEQSLADFELHGGILREGGAVFEEILVLVDDGMTSFKMYTAYESGVSNGFFKWVLDRLAERDTVGVIHSGDDSVCRTPAVKLRAIGEDAPETYPQLHPDYAEMMATSDAIIFATEAGAGYYGIHTTCWVTVDVLTRHREDGLWVRAETCTYYTTLDDSAYVELGNLPKIVLSIRKEDDVEAIFGYLRRGVLSVVSTGHVTSKHADKVDRLWQEGPFGTSGVQVSLPMFYNEAVNEHGLPYPFLVHVMCLNPVKAFGPPNKGTLEPGVDADIVLFDPDETYATSTDANAPKVDYSICEGREVTGRVMKTFVRGEAVAADGEVVSDPGHGWLVECECLDWST